MSDVPAWQEAGYELGRDLDNGEFVAVMPLTYGRGRIIKGNAWGVLDSW